MEEMLPGGARAVVILLGPAVTEVFPYSPLTVSSAIVQATTAARRKAPVSAAGICHRACCRSRRAHYRCQLDYEFDLSITTTASCHPEARIQIQFQSIFQDSAACEQRFEDVAGSFGTPFSRTPVESNGDGK
jgi:hypothetical protein